LDSLCNPGDRFSRRIRWAEGAENPHVGLGGPATALAAVAKRFFRVEHDFNGGAYGELLGKEPSVGPGAEEGDKIEDLIKRERVEEPLRHR
jgi:hypothetical protein